MYCSISCESKEKGDEGNYAAIDAARLARALRGATAVRCAGSRSLTGRPAGAAWDSLTNSLSNKRGGVTGESAPTAAATTPARQTSTQDFAKSVVADRPQPLGVLARPCQASNTTECVRARVRWEVLGLSAGVDDDVATGFSPRKVETQVGVGLPDDARSVEFGALLPLLHCVHPRSTLTYDDLQKLLELLAAGPTGPATLDLSGGTVTPVCCCCGGGGGGGGDGDVLRALSQRMSVTALERRMAELEGRYPLPESRPSRKSSAEGSDDSAVEESARDEDEEGDDASRKENGELRARCEQLKLPYSSYRAALRDVALTESAVFPLLCEYLCKDSRLVTLLLSGNSLGAESQRQPSEGGPVVELRDVRALARMLDANETLKAIDLSHNALGPNGIGIIAKALTKNISLEEVDLSENNLNAEPLEELEDPDYTEEDPMFGARYAGLEAVSEVLKKNKFIRVLRLAGNGIHAGEDLSAPAEDAENDDDADAEQDTHSPSSTSATPADVVESWEERPLWKLVQPLQYFHRLTVLDLRGNHLGAVGARMLATALSTNRSVRALDLTDNGIGYRGLRYLATLVLGAPTSALETLILQRNELAGHSQNPNTQRKLRMKPRKAVLAAMGAFAAAVKSSRTLRRLVLSENHLGPVLSAAVLSTVAEARALRELDVSWNEACGDRGGVVDLHAVHSLAAALCPAVSTEDAVSPPPSAPTLERLFFSGNNLCAVGLAALLANVTAAPPAGATAGPLCPLHELDLSRNYVGDSVTPVAELLQLPPSRCALRRLHLAFNQITSASALLPGVRANTTLECLDLSHNLLGSQEELRHVPDAAAAVAAPHAQQEQEQELAELWNALARHPTLRELDLSGNDLRPAHAESFIAAFDGASPLEKLSLATNPQIPAPLVRRLIESLAGRPGMRVLHTSLAPPSAAGPANAPSDATQIVAAMAHAAAQSASLVDLRCDGAVQAALLAEAAGGERAESTPPPAATEDTAADGSGAALAGESQVAQQVNEAAQKLLLNALLATSA